MGLFSNLFGKSTDFSAMVKEGAMIVDVRTTGEFAGGHIKGSKNIPLQDLSNNLKNLPKDKAIITCCASGMRSASAKNILKNNGYNQVYNGGAWMQLRGEI